MKIGGLGLIKGLFGKSSQNYVEADDELTTPRVNADTLVFNRFASFLPYSGFDERNDLFVIESDEPGVPEGLGFVLEISPQIGANLEMANYLANLFNLGAPVGTGIQVQIFGSPILDGMFADMTDSLQLPEANPEQGRLLLKMTENRIRYYHKAATAKLFNNFNYRIRNFCCNISVVVPVKDIESEIAIRQIEGLRQQVITVLSQYHLYLYTWGAEHLINYLSMLLNPHKMMAGERETLYYDPSRELRYQVVATDTRAVEHEQHIVYSGAHDSKPVAIRAMSVRSYPPEFGLNHMGELLGSSTSTAIAYPCAFVITMGVTLPGYEAEKNTTMLKSARALQTAESQIAKLMPHLREVSEDWNIAQRAFDEGPGTCKLYHQLLLIGDEEDLGAAEQAAKAVWRSERFELNTDRKMQKQALLASMPMMFGPLLQKDLRTAQRMQTKTVFNATNLLPLIGEWTGTPPRQGQNRRTPLLQFCGRKGQIFGVDIFANPNGNYNGAVVGTSGSGKSNLLNELTTNTLARGGRVWIIDVGRSYEKLCRMLGGQYVEFSADSNVQLNPFSLVRDIDEDMEMLKPMLAQMISPSRPLSDYELSQLELHVRSVWFDHGTSATIDHLAESLKNNCAMGGPNPKQDDLEWKKKIDEMSFEDRQKHCDIRIRDLGVQLLPYTTDGTYGKYFSGQANINFRSNFIVLELEELKSKRDLQSVVMLMLMYRITQDMYVSDRKQPKLVIIDEAWDLMGSGDAADFIEAGYRRARKYGGAFFTATQGVNDYYQSKTAQAAFDNADWMFLMRQKDESIEALAASGKIVMDEYTKKMMRSVTTVSGAYSEVFIRGGDFPPVVGRLFFDPFSMLLASTRADDFEAVRAYTKKGMSTEDAVEAVLRDRESSKAERRVAACT